MRSKTFTAISFLTAFPFSARAKISSINQQGEGVTYNLINGQNGLAQSPNSTPSPTSPATFLPSQNPTTSPEQTSASTSAAAPTSLFAGLTLLVIIGIIAVIAVVVGVKRAKIGKPQGASPSQQVPYQARAPV